MSKESDIETANIVLSQLGGYGRLKAAIAIYDHYAIKSGLSFKFKGSRKVNYCKIVLNCFDIYDIEFGKVQKFDYTVIKTLDNVYCDQLIDIFEKETGLYLTLCARN